MPNPPHLLHPKYRPDIDGLRAIAVLSVVVFHLFPDWLKGGFIGVDIFFVISGYLISLIIFGSLEHHGFSYLEFYARRTKRIFPALLLVLASSLAFAWLNLFPEEFQKLCTNIFAGSLFVANIFAMLQSSYFEPVQAYNPMLHLWSLGIEEQYYILWPVLLVIAWKRKWNFLGLTLVLLIASFLVNVYLTKTQANLAFYLPITRFWELMLGGILAYLSLHKIQHLEHCRNGLATAGLILICAGLVLLDKEHAFPGWWALLPTLGAALVISAGPGAWLNRHLLAHPVLVWVGLISYPLYLWHWPLLSFTRYAASGSVLSNAHLGIILLASIVLASLTFWLVEKPCRKRGGNALITVLLALMLVIAAIALLIIFKAGFPHRFEHPELVNSASSANRINPGIMQGNTVKGRCLLDDETRQQALFCQSDIRLPSNLAVWGDSHALALYPGLVKNGKAGYSWILAGRTGCAPLTGVNIVSDPVCSQLNEGILRTLASSEAIKTVLLVAAQRSVNGDPTTFAKGLSNSINRLMAAKKRVIFLIGGPNIIQTDRYFNSFCFERPIGLELESKAKYCSIPRAQHESYATESHRIARALQARWPQLIVVDPTSQLCDDLSCAVLKQGKSLYSFTDHLSDYGSLLVSALIYQQSPDLLQ